MPVVEKEYFEPDQIPTAAELNAAYDALAVASADIDETNQGAGWLTFKHLDSPSTLFPINKLYNYFHDGNVARTYTNTTYESVKSPAPASTPCEVALNYFPKDNEMIRIHISGLVGQNTVVQDYDFVGTNLGKPNYYAFRIKLTYSDSGGADQSLIVGYWGYSFTTNGLNRYVTTAGKGPEINWQTFQASTIVKYTGTTGVREYKKATLEVALFDSANTLAITRHQIQCVQAKR
jgi:hypothetical protein